MAKCTHLDGIGDPPPRSAGCHECIELGQRWVELRKCLTCGHVGCCDSSPGRHARQHHRVTSHPLIEPVAGERWTWCYIDDAYVDRDAGSQPQP